MLLLALLAAGGPTASSASTLLQQAAQLGSVVGTVAEQEGFGERLEYSQAPCVAPPISLAIIRDQDPEAPEHLVECRDITAHERFECGEMLEELRVEDALHLDLLVCRRKIGRGDTAGQIPQLRQERRPESQRVLTLPRKAEVHHVHL